MIYKVFGVSPLLQGGKASDLSSWLDIMIDNLFIVIFGQRVFKQSLDFPMGTDCKVFQANFYLVTYEKI
jgi:hypothetical protein